MTYLICRKSLLNLGKFIIIIIIIIVIVIVIFIVIIIIIFIRIFLQGYRGFFLRSKLVDETQS